MNYYTRMPTKHFQEVKREGLFTCPLICYKYSAILSDGQWIHQNFLVWKKKWTIKNHANQVSKKQNSKSIRKETTELWYSCNILEHIYHIFNNVFLYSNQVLFLIIKSMIRKIFKGSLIQIGSSIQKGSLIQMYLIICAAFFEFCTFSRILNLP